MILMKKSYPQLASPRGWGGGDDDTSSHLLKGTVGY